MIPLLLALGIGAAMVLGWDDNADKPQSSVNTDDKPKKPRASSKPAEPPADDEKPKE